LGAVGDEAVADQLRRHNRQISEQAAEIERLSTATRGAVDALREIRRAALSTAGGDRERYRAKVAEIIEITGHHLGGQ
jgi:hypothetical protein